MNQDDPSSLSEWLRERPWVAVVLVSLLVLVGGSAVALNRGSSGSDSGAATEVLDAATPEPTTTVIDDVLPTTGPVVPPAPTSGTPTASASASASSTASPSSSPSAAAAPTAPTAPRPAGPRPRTAAPSPADPTDPPSEEPEPAPTSTSPTPTGPAYAGSATVTILNDFPNTVAFQVNGAFSLIGSRESVTLKFQVRSDDQDSFTISAISGMPCGSTGRGLGVEPGGSYAITVVSVADACGDAPGPRVSSVPWPSA